MDESLYVLYTRNYKRKTIYYIQETKIISEKIFTLILKRNRNYVFPAGNYLFKVNNRNNRTR